MKEQIVKAIVNLFKIKSLVTLAMTGSFIFCVIKFGEIPKPLETIYTFIISFYFGTQAEKVMSKVKEDEENIGG